MQDELSEADASAIESACIGMLEAWYSGDGERARPLLHEEFAKRGVIPDQDSQKARILHMGKAKFIEGIDTGAGKLPEDEWDIDARILAATPRMATVEVTSRYLVDVCQVAKVDGRWQIVNVLWEMRGTPPWWK